MNRRTFLRAAAAAGVVPAAGCLGGGGGEVGPPDSKREEWLSDARNHDGMVDRTGRGEVTVAVGAGDGGLAFDPPGVTVSTGTTVVWEWTGNGGQHNVVSDRGAFESEFASSEGHTFSYTVENAGNFLYYCKPHRAVGMKGAVHVE